VGRPAASVGLLAAGRVVLRGLHAGRASIVTSRAYGPDVDERKLLIRLARGELANVAFGDAIRLLECLGFELSRVSGSHHVFAHPDIAELLNLQSIRGQAKPYQLRQLMRLVERYDLGLRN
jgi:predicted RNA binding protein YcfA (HicA-like mRNA interferase family)